MVPHPPDSSTRPSPDLGRRIADCGCCVIFDTVSLREWAEKVSIDLLAEADICNRPGQLARLDAIAREIEGLAR